MFLQKTFSTLILTTNLQGLLLFFLLLFSFSFLSFLCWAKVKLLRARAEIGVSKTSKVKLFHRKTPMKESCFRPISSLTWTPLRKHFLKILKNFSEKLYFGTPLRLNLFLLSKNCPNLW